MSELPRDLSPVDAALFGARTVLIFGQIDMKLAGRVSAELMALSATSAEPILVVINSPGGHVEAGDTIHDVIRFVRPEVRVLGTGWVASAGALAYAGAKREHRFALPNTRFLLHQPLGETSGRASDVETEAAQIVAMRKRLDAIFARATGQPVEKIHRDSERNHWMTASEALEYGLVGRIVESAGEL